MIDIQLMHIIYPPAIMTGAGDNRDGRPGDFDDKSVSVTDRDASVVLFICLFGYDRASMIH